MDPKKSIKEYYGGKNIFLTGGSGFVGKALIEKLLRSCPDVETIYILLRPKKGKSVFERIEQITSDPLFDTLKKENPENLKKIIPIEGYAAEPRLGISEENRRLLIEKVNIFFHAAASVKFDDFLKDAIFINIRSAREAALLALEMKKIEVFMHVSTTYCTIDKAKVIQEVLYPTQGHWKEAIEIAEKCDTTILNTLSQKYLDKFPNTYTYTKLLAEHCINDTLVGKLPTIICRPSVVVSTLVEPFPGWIDNINGPVGLLLAGGSGLLRTVYGNPDVDTDYISVDNVVKVMIVTAWHKTNFGTKDCLSIYHASKYNQVLFKQAKIVELGKRLYWDVPFEKKIWFPGNSMTKCWYNYFTNVILFHMFPAFILDLLIRAAGYKPILFKIQRKIYIGNMAVSPFTLNEWHFVNTNALNLLNAIPSENIKDFNYKIVPPGEEGLYDYYRVSCDHARRHLLKEKGDILEKTRKRTKMMHYLDRTVKYTFFSFIAWQLFFKINIIAVLYSLWISYWNGL